MSRIAELLLLASDAAGRADADVGWLCRLQRRYANAPFRTLPFPIPSPRSPMRPVRCARPPRRAPRCCNRRRRRNLRTSSSRRCRRLRLFRRLPIRPAPAACRGRRARHSSSYAPPQRPAIETTATVPPRSVAATRPSANGGTTIIVGTSDTLDILAKRYNVSSAAILQANGYKGPRTLSPGQQLVIPPRQAVAAAPAPAVAPPANASLRRRRRRASTTSIAATR